MYNFIRDNPFTVGLACGMSIVLVSQFIHNKRYRIDCWVRGYHRFKRIDNKQMQCRDCGKVEMIPEHWDTKNEE